MVGKKPMITKCCPNCNFKIPVASKSCKSCNYSYNARGRDRRELEDDETFFRRTSRKTRGKPNYYDSQEFDKRKKKPKKTRQNSIHESSSPTEKSNIHKETTAARAKRRRLKKEEEDGSGDLVAKLPPEKQELASIILSEINRKLQLVVWKP